MFERIHEKAVYQYVSEWLPGLNCSDNNPLLLYEIILLRYLFIHVRPSVYGRLFVSITLSDSVILSYSTRVLFWFFLPFAGSFTFVFYSVQSKQIVTIRVPRSGYEEKPTRVSGCRNSDTDTIEVLPYPSVIDDCEYCARPPRRCLANISMGLPKLTQNVKGSSNNLNIIDTKDSSQIVQFVKLV